jgi:hypothetical protein
MAKRCRDGGYLNQGAEKKQKLTQSSEISEIRKMLTYLMQKTVTNDPIIQNCVKKINELEQTTRVLQIENQKYKMQISAIYAFANIAIPQYRNSHPSYIS